MNNDLFIVYVKLKSFCLELIYISFTIKPVYLEKSNGSYLCHLISCSGYQKVNSQLFNKMRFPSIPDLQFFKQN